ncbi:MAG TPA: hypothetical protein VG963_33185 [Polyangiaceae bacterium]|nr:hypothetical protein [Polyangiaceae bacterium]
MGKSNGRGALRAIEVTFRGMAPRDALVYFVRRCAAVKRLRGEALRASLQHLPAQGYHVALELRSGGRVFRASAIHAAAIVAVCRSFEALVLPPWLRAMPSIG